MVLLGNAIVSRWNIIWSASNDEAKKMGLYIYSACEVLSIVLPWMILKTVRDEAAAAAGGMKAQAILGEFDVFVSITMVALSVIPAVFLIMYWTNVKKLS